ncbi:MAG TPA: EAL domain-containing protein [Rhodocyclaceae bacterium]
MKPKTIRGLLMTAAVVFSLALFTLIVLLVSVLHERAVRDEAARNSDVLAQVTFNAMFQLMSTGWNRAQLESFTQAISKAVADSPTTITIYRGKPIEALFGAIPGKQADATVEAVLAGAGVTRSEVGDEVRSVFPVVAKEVCQRCHYNVQVGTVMGAIDVHQQVSGAIGEARRNLIIATLPVVPLALVATLLMAAYINRRITGSIDLLAEDIQAVTRVADLRRLGARSGDFGFAEFGAISHEIRQLTEKLRSIAVDKSMLEFEIRLLEKFVITSEVVRDWREYVNHLLIEINDVMEAYALFSIFKVDDELFDLEVFWYRQPAESVRVRFEAALHDALSTNPYFGDGYAVNIVHNVADRSGRIDELPEESLKVQTKSLMVAAPKIGGIVGIGVQAQSLDDASRELVLESILSTLLNVVGSVKAIHKYTKELEYYATRDPLTNLYNQRVFWELLDNELARSERHGSRFALVVIDLDNFKSVNDTFGHAVGDIFLQQVSAVMREALRGDDLLARYGGDEFVAILPEADLGNASEVAARINRNVEAMTVDTADGAHVRGSVSIGLAVYPDHARETRDLFLFADSMMYRAKADGKNRVAIPTEQDVVEVFRSIGEKSQYILQAVEDRRVEPYFQPIVEMGSGRIAAVEVLGRLRVGDDRLLVGDDFVPLAEKMGVMHRLDYILMEKALAAVAEAGFAGDIFLNMSPRALVLNDFIAQVGRIASDSGIAPERIVFEITERETIKNMAVLEKFIASLKQDGFKLAIDDFGSGFSSFHYVKRFPIDILKIEGDFVLNMVNSDKDRALVRSIVALAKELGIRTVAEYVETEAVFDAVQELGIDLGQGHHIGRPRAAVGV